MVPQIEDFVRQGLLPTKGGLMKTGAYAGDNGMLTQALRRT